MMGATTSTFIWMALKPMYKAEPWFYSCSIVLFDPHHSRLDEKPCQGAYVQSSGIVSHTQACL